jgi:hypothetical protein
VWGTERCTEDPDNVDGEEDEEQAYPLVDELFSRIEELEVKVWMLDRSTRATILAHVTSVIRGGNAGCYGRDGNQRRGRSGDGGEDADDG